MLVSIEAAYQQKRKNSSAFPYYGNKMSEMSGGPFYCSLFVKMSSFFPVLCGIKILIISHCTHLGLFGVHL